MEANQETKKTWLDRPILTTITLNWETIIFSIIMVLAVATRFYDLESRVMSHDENSHVYYSWRLSEGQGYQHTPLTHGPLLFHLTAFSYFLFGDNDFTARIPFAVFSIATIGFLAHALKRNFIFWAFVSNFVFITIDLRSNKFIL